MVIIFHAVLSLSSTFFPLDTPWVTFQIYKKILTKEIVIFKTGLNYISHKLFCTA